MLLDASDRETSASRSVVVVRQRLGFAARTYPGIARRCLDPRASNTARHLSKAERIGGYNDRSWRDDWESKKKRRACRRGQNARTLCPSATR